VEGGALSFNVEGKQTLEVPLTDVAQATAQKNEAIIEMAADDTALPDDELLVEIRFHLPQVTGEDMAAEVDGTPAEGFVELVKQSGDLEVAGSTLVTLEEIQVQVPRGRYEIELCDKFMKLHGKSNDYKVMYTAVSALYLLPKPDGYHMSLAIALEHPLRQGATSYPHIVLQLPRDAPLELEVALSEAECQARFGDKLDKFEQGDMPGVVAKAIAAFAKKKVSGIKAGGFNGDSKDDRAKSIRCSLKAAEGFLYPLNKEFFFLSNKPVLVEFEKVASVEFNRVDAKQQQAQVRTFDITVHMREGLASHQFVNLQRSEYKELFRFLKSKNLRIKNIASANYGEAAAGSDGDDDDPYMATVRREREEAQQAMLEDEDDDDDEDDEDFKAGDDSDVDEEFDEGDDDDDERAGKGDDDDDDDDDDDAAAPPPKKRKTKDASDGSGDDDEDAPLQPPPKKKGKEKMAEAAMGIMAKAKAAKKPKKEKAKKDKNEPKRGQSAYMLWMNGAGRPLAKEALGDGASIGDIGKWCGAKWKEMNAAARAEWDEKAAADKARYEREMAEYKSKIRQQALAAAADDDDDDEEAPEEDDDA